MNSPTTTDVRTPTEAGETLLRTVGLAKSFGATRAVRDMTFDVRPGEVHAIMGENGSGKSTLVKMLSGVHEPDRGDLFIAGSPVGSMREPRFAQQQGVVTVFQEVLTVDNRSVLDNVWLGADGIFTRKLGRATREARAREVLAELLEKPPALDQLGEELTLSERQACCIARALVRDPKVLILDEATSSLDYDTCQRLFGIVSRLRDKGVGILLITHRMDEIKALADRITVLRSGVAVETIDGEWTTSMLVQLMTGNENLGGEATREPPVVAADAPVVLSTDDLRLTPSSPPIEFSLRAGELVGLAGLEGHGQDAFIRALAGIGTAEGDVLAHTEGQTTQIRSLQEAYRSGIVYVPRERRAQAMFGWMSIQDNFAIPTLDRDSRGGWLSPRRSAARLGEYISKLKIKLGSPADAITTLSGGNQQKVIIARWLAAGPGIILLDDPTRGIDINAKRDLYALLRELTGQGLAVVMLSTELDEHLELMTRTLVFHEQQVVAELPHAGLTREGLLARFFGRDIA